MEENVMTLLAMIVATAGCLAFVIFAIWKLKKKQNRKNEHLDKVSDVIVKSHNRNS